MEFEEVRNFIEMGHVEGASLSTTSLQWRHPALVDPFVDSFSRREQHQVSNQRRGTMASSKRPNPILGVSRLVNSVRRLKRKDSTNMSTTAEVYRRAAQLSPENTTPHTNILPVLTVDTGSTPSPLLNNSMNKNNHLAALSLQQPQPPIVSLSAPSSPEEPEVSCNLHEIKCQMQNFVVPTDWYPTGSQAPCFDHESIESINAQKIIAHLKEGIARFEYLIHLEEQKIESNKSEMVEYMKKLKTMDKEAEHVNAMITYGRFDAVTRMKTLLREVNSCVPRLQILRGQHKHTTTSIEGYNKSMNMTDRLEILQVQARTTTRTEAVWTRVRHWGPFITIITLSMLIALLAVR